MEDVLDHISTSPTFVDPNLSISKATQLIGEKLVWDLPVVSKDMSLRFVPSSQSSRILFKKLKINRDNYY